MQRAGGLAGGPRDAGAGHAGALHARVRINMEATQVRTSVLKTMQQTCSLSVLKPRCNLPGRPLTV
jgi:hypothetical protein